MGWIAVKMLYNNSYYPYQKLKIKNLMNTASIGGQIWVIQDNVPNKEMDSSFNLMWT